jgi:hypothetical protein
MTSEEIKLAFPYTVPSRESTAADDPTFWLKEIAYQLAVMNERNNPTDWAESFALSVAVMAAIWDREKNNA